MNNRHFDNGYTDSPNLHPNLVVGSLHLLFWLVFHPSAWIHYVARLDPHLRPDFKLTDLHGARRRNPALRRLTVQAHLILPLLVSLFAGAILWRRSMAFADVLVPAMFNLFLSLTLSLMLGLVVSSAAGLVGGVVIGLTMGVVGTVTTGITNNIAVPVCLGLAVGMVGNIAVRAADGAGTTSPVKKLSTLQLRVGGIIVGVLIGVLAGTLLRWEITTLAALLTTMPDDTAFSLARGIVVGASFGLAVGLHRGVGAGLVSGLASGLLYVLAINGGYSDLGWMIVGPSSGLIFGLAFGVTIVFPYILAERIAGPWAGAWAAALGSWGRHVAIHQESPAWPTWPLGLIAIVVGLSLSWWQSVLFYPLTSVWNLVLYRFDQSRANAPRSLLRWHSAFWDELQSLPLGWLDDYLLLVIERNAAEGQAALKYLTTSRQSWAAQSAQIELEARRLERSEHLEAIGQAHHNLAAGNLAGAGQALLRSFSHLSQDVDAALNQTTAYHRRLALSNVDDRLNRLVRELTASSEPYAKRFYPIAVKWQQLVAAALDCLVETVEQSQEIDNPYIVGVPLTWQQEIFVGRTDIVDRIEQLLLDRRRPPLLLYGQRRMGKTSLLRNLGRLLPRAIIPLFVDCQRTSLATDYPDLLYNIAGEMVKSAAEQRGLTLPPINRDTLTAHPFTYFNEWLDEIEQTLARQGYKIALLALDEFEMLDAVLHKGRFDEADVLSMLRHMIQHRPMFKVMLAGSHTLEAFERWAGYLINVQVVKVGYLKPDEARQLVEHPVQNFAMRYEPDAAHRVIEITRGHPALIQLLCYEIVTLKNEHPAARRRLACRTDVEAAVPHALESGNFFFVDIQQNQVDEAGLVLLQSLASHGEGAVIPAATLAAHLNPSVDLPQTLQSLLRRDLIEKVEHGYRFQVELIRRWFA